MTELGYRPGERSARGLAKAVGQAIRSGEIKPGTKLPPIRSVARELDLSPATVHSAWGILARSGIVRSDGRRGTTVTDLYSTSIRYSQALERKQTFELDLSMGTPDLALLPDLERALTDHAFSTLTAGYLEPPAVFELVTLLRTLWPYAAEAFMITDGAMDAVELVSHAHVRFGDRVILEDPGFPLLIDGLEASGAEIVGVKVDDQGMLARPLTEALAHQPAAAVYLQPRAQNPTGVSLSPSRARELAGIIEQTSAMVIEDDSAGAIASTPALSLGAWLPNRTLHIRSFSKSHGPDLRLAAVSGPAATIREITARRQLGQGWTSRLLQRILLNLLRDNEATDAVVRARETYRFRREAIAAELAEHGVRINAADGFNLWIPVADETSALVRLASQGIGVSPGSAFMLTDNQGDHIRVTISAVRKDYKNLAAIIADAASAAPRTMRR